MYIYCINNKQIGTLADNHKNRQKYGTQSMVQWFCLCVVRRCDFAHLPNWFPVVSVHRMRRLQNFADYCKKNGNGLLPHHCIQD